MRPWHPRRKRLRVRWGAGKVHNFDWDPSADGGAHITNHGIIILHPGLRLPEAHDERYETLGHELLHVLGMDEETATQFERRVGQALHDLLTGFKPPPCDCGPER